MWGKVIICKLRVCIDATWQIQLNNHCMAAIGECRHYGWQRGLCSDYCMQSFYYYYYYYNSVIIYSERRQ